MSKLDYLDALKRAMTGLAPALQAKTLAYYEQRFVDGVAAGRSEAAVAAELDDPKKIAMTLRASAHLAAFEQKRNPANFLRMLVAGLGLALFNLLMVVPAAVYLSLLAALYAVALGFYIIGIAVTASGLAGANELVLERPFGIVLSDDSDGSERSRQTHISISESGINISRDRPVPRAPQPPQPPASLERSQPPAPAQAQAPRPPTDTDADADASDMPAPGADSGAPRAAAVIERAEDVAGGSIRITTDVDAGSRTTQTAFGMVMVVGAILLFLLSLVVSKYTLLGMKRYLQMNLSLLHGS